MPTPPTLPCTDWTDEEAVACLFPDISDTRGACADPDDEPIPASYAWNDAELIRIASRILFLRTCRRFPGECVVELRPCDPCKSCSSCKCWYTFIPLAGQYPILDVLEVKIDGVVIDPNSYRVDEYRRLVRTDGGSWPRNQNLNSDPDEVGSNSFVIRYTTGRAIPEDLRYAATLLVGELKRACAGSESCKLPDRVTSVVRDGVSFDLVDPQEIANGSSFGVPMIDSILKSYPCDDARRPRLTSRLMHPLLDGSSYDRSGVRG